ncbi:uncharacterized protein Z520_10560 [Fonsecaea multimorphosa CBS 102226]|uniref:FCP1 homology domain-containing protein n=1 Tax=Fonsecaea multimorphosa CBS 102226 TaxID=1442371 RepID=A0A0D2JT33_9EURO|nr:uncharacterized protein Z520_10560 [Fonsecaea multimorphosa CBS 102226]KIX93654.1 hypothetical protein Z520_10560 [Fonsecaea multimorphosa CBS 102226]OAL19767.1 hypothetical protein AYO22_09294 [Fonsecaea multimorphosa]
MGKSRGDRYRSNNGQLPGPPDAVPQESQSRIVGAYESYRPDGGAYDSYRPDRFAQIRQGDYFDCYNQYRIDIYNAVDSWRSYRNDDSTLQSAGYYQSAYHGSAGNPQHQMYPPATARLGVGSSAAQASQVQPSYYTPYQPLRSVHNYARYPTYRVDKPYRVSDGTRERYIVQQAQNILPIAQPHNTPRYQLRQRRPEQIAPYSTAAAAKRGQVETTAIPAISRRDRWTPEVKPPPAPIATEEYKSQAALPPALRQTPQKLLVILDLNGTLLVRPSHHRPKYIIVRPGVRQLLDYLFQNHVVMVYSSAKPENCAAMVNQFFHPTQRSAMAGVWARDKLGLNKLQYDTKVQVYKKLEPIWEDETIRKKAGPGQKWDQSNTVLVDDSQLKALGQPHNLLQIPEFFNNAPKTGGQALLNWQREQEQIVYSIQQKLEELKWQVDVSRTIREWQTGKRQAPGVVDETVDQKALQGTQDRDLSPTPSIGSPAPSVGEREASLSLQLQTPEASVLSDAEVSSLYEPDGGVKIAAESTALDALDELEKEIDRSLNLNQKQKSQDTDPTVSSATATTGVQDQDQRRSESPIDESVWADILRGRGDDAGHVDKSVQKTTQARDQGSREKKTPGQKASADQEGKSQQRQRRKRGRRGAKESESLKDVPPTPESMDA